MSEFFVQVFLVGVIPISYGLFLIDVFLPGMQMPLALLNARMSAKSFERWSLLPARSLVAAMLLQFSLITPLVVSLISYVLWRLVKLPSH